MHVVPRVRLALARRPWLYWSFVALCALVVWAGVRSATSAARTQQQRWGSTRAVLVATQAVGAGQPIRASPHEYPAAMVPASALAGLPPAAVALHPISAGEVIVQADVAGARDAPAGWVVFAVAGANRPTLVTGDAVAVFGGGTRWCDGLVAGTSADRVEVAVPPSCADGVSGQVAAGGVVLARAAAR